MEGVKMVLAPCSHQVQLICQARKGMGTPDKAGQAITLPGAGQDPPGPAKHAATAASFLDTSDSIKSNCQ